VINAASLVANKTRQPKNRLQNINYNVRTGRVPLKVVKNVSQCFLFFYLSLPGVCHLPWNVRLHHFSFNELRNKRFTQLTSTYLPLFSFNNPFNDYFSQQRISFQILLLPLFFLPNLFDEMAN